MLGKNINNKIMIKIKTNTLINNKTYIIMFKFCSEIMVTPIIFITEDGLSQLHSVLKEKTFMFRG